MYKGINQRRKLKCVPFCFWKINACHRDFWQATPSFSQLAWADDYFALLVLFKLFLEKKAFQWFDNKGSFFFIPMDNMTLNEKGLDFFGTIFMGDLNNVFITYSKKLGHEWMNEKGHILVNLGQI